MVIIGLVAQILLVAVIPALIYLFSLGVQAAGLARSHKGYHAYTLYFLALYLCEPLVNFVLIVALMFTVSDSSASSNSRTLQTAFLTTAPMAVLLTPAAGLFFHAAFYRGRSLRILLLGLLRWTISLAAVYFLNQPAYELAPSLLMLLAGAGLLWFSALWGRQQLVGPLAAPRASTGVDI